MPPQTKAISDSMMVHCVAISRFDRMSQKLNCIMGYTAALNRMRPRPRSSARISDRQQQIDQRHQEIDLEVAEIARRTKLAA